MFSTGIPLIDKAFGIIEDNAKLIGAFIVGCFVGPTISDLIDEVRGRL